MSAHRHAHRSKHDQVLRPMLRLAALLLLLGLTVGAGAGVGRVGAQGGGYAIRYHGTLTLGGAPAAGQEILAVVARTPTDTTLCARTTSGAGGAYTIDIPRDPRCVRRTRADPVPTWLFLVNREQVGRDNRGIQLEPPSNPLVPPDQNRALGGKTIPGQTAPAQASGAGGAAPGAGPELIVVRYFGVLTHGDSARPAPRGTVVSVFGDGTVECGEGRVLDEVGHYAVDIPPRPGCVAARARERDVQWEFRVGGETAGRASRGLSLDEPDLFAQAEELPLHTRATPRPPLEGGVAVDECLVDERTERLDERCPDVPGRVLVEGDGEFTARVTDCFRRYRQASAGSPVMDMLLALHRSPAAGPPLRATIQQSLGDVILPFGHAMGMTTPESWDLAETSMPTNATVQVYSQAFLSLVGLPDAPDQVDWCALLAHELTHAADFLAGTLDQTPCGAGGWGAIAAAELKAQAVANSFLIGEGREPRPTYGDTPLPLTAFRPTRESWDRYRRNEICPSAAQEANACGDWRLSLAGLYSGLVGQPVVLSARIEPAGFVATRWTWDFGDGTGASGEADAASASGQAVEKTYAAPGAYPVTVQVEGEGDCADGMTAITLVTIAAALFGDDIGRGDARVAPGWHAPVTGRRGRRPY